MRAISYYIRCIWATLSSKLPCRVYESGNDMGTNCPRNLDARLTCSEGRCCCRCET